MLVHQVLNVSKSIRTRVCPTAEPTATPAAVVATDSKKRDMSIQLASPSYAETKHLLWANMPGCWGAAWARAGGAAAGAGAIACCWGAGACCCWAGGAAGLGADGGGAWRAGMVEAWRVCWAGAERLVCQVKGKRKSQWTYYGNLLGEAFLMMNWIRKKRWVGVWLSFCWWEGWIKTFNVYANRVTLICKNLYPWGWLRWCCVATV